MLTESSTSRKRLRFLVRDSGGFTLLTLTGSSFGGLPDTELYRATGNRGVPRARLWIRPPVLVLPLRRSEEKALARRALLEAVDGAAFDAETHPARV
jgi:hypothetical protein